MISIGGLNDFHQYIPNKASSHIFIKRFLVTKVLRAKLFFSYFWYEQ